MKLAFIVQRYGKEILGGSETLARQLAERLSRRHEITVLTTTAKDYITWKNEYEPGEETQRGVRIVRFPVEGERDIDAFNKFSEEIYNGEPTREQELEWLERQGPVSPALIEYLKKEHGRFELLIFFTYLYYPTYYGLHVAPDKSVLVPTAHDEPPLKLGIFKEMFQLPSSFLFNTEAEELLTLERFPVHKKMRETIGMGMELLDQPDPSIFRKQHDVSGKYFLYAGRIDGGKGLEELFRFFTFYKEEYPASGNLQLILIGKLGMKLPDDKSIRYVGFVDEAEKLSAMAGAIAVFQPSKMESLSIVTLEAFSVGTPVIVNAASRVLLDHCRKANAGFYYGDFEEFEEVVSLLLSDRNLARSLGKNGQRYVKDNYGWQKLLTKYELALRASARPMKETKESRRRDRAEPKEEPRSSERGRDRDRDRDKAEASAAPMEASEEASPAPEAVSEASDPDATLAVDAPDSDRAEAPPATEEPKETLEPREPDREPELQAPEPEEASEPEPAPGEPAESEAPPQSSERAAAPEVEPPSEHVAHEPEAEAAAAPEDEVEDVVEEVAEEVVEEVAEDVAHLPSFFRAAIPPRPAEPTAKRSEEVRSRPTPTPPPPPPPRADGELPEFFRPKPKDASAPAEEPAAEPPEPGPATNDTTSAD